MAAPGSSSSCWSVPEVYKHHEQRKVCISRPKYREGRKAKAVKVYTINLESRYVMVQGVPAIGVMTELVQLCALYGVVEEYRPLDEYPAEEFTEVYLVKFQKLTSARAAKRRMDETSFYGGVLHVCYVPEYESVEDTRLKLQDRRRYVIRTARNKAREKEVQEEEVNRELTSAEAATTSEKIPSRNHHNSVSNETGESSGNGYYTSFPLLPLPPQERGYRGQHLHTTVPTEDKMGTLHNAITDTEQSRPSQTQSSNSSLKDRSPERRRPWLQAAAVRFVPRTTCLENRKRKMEETVGESLIGVTGKNEPLIGPELPEPPRLDMKDESLNTTARLIRNTMKQVASVPDLKPTEKKVKPRRRI